MMLYIVSLEFVRDEISTIEWLYCKTLLCGIMCHNNDKERFFSQWDR